MVTWRRSSTAPRRWSALWWFAAFPRAGRILLAGRLEEADTLAKEALEIGLATQPIHEVRMHFGVQRFQIRLEQGRLDELVANLAGALADADHPETRAMLAQAYCELGDRDDARATFAALAPRLPGLPLDPNWIVTITRSAAVCGELGETSVAAPLYELLLPYAERVAGQGIVWTGSVHHYLGVLAGLRRDPTRAEAHFAAAEAMHQRIDAPTWLARTRLEWARMLSARHQPGDAARARELLGKARAAAREFGLANVERHAIELLSSR
jgi:tetratricopeptide (TPR) repeat protein